MSVLNKANIGIYDVESVPERDDGSDRSRFAVGRLPEGWPAESTAQAVNQSLERILERRKEEAPPITPERQTISLKYVQQIDGEYVLLHRGEITGTPTFANTRPTKFKRLRVGGGALIDELFLTDDSAIRDDQAWQALRLLAERENVTGFELRRLNDLTAELLALRAGLTVRSDELPPPPTEMDKEDRC